MSCLWFSLVIVEGQSREMSNAAKYEIDELPPKFKCMVCKKGAYLHCAWEVLPDIVTEEFGLRASADRFFIFYPDYIKHADVDVFRLSAEAEASLGMSIVLIAFKYNAEFDAYDCIRVYFGGSFFDVLNYEQDGYIPARWL